MPKKQPIRGRGFGGRTLTKAQWRQTKKQMKRESAKGYKKTLKAAERFQTKYPTPTKIKPKPVQMQKAANERIETLRNENHRLTSRVTQLTRQLEEVSRIAQVQRLLQPGI
jgi:hypothetical protein